VERYDEVNNLFFCNIHFLSLPYICISVQINLVDLIGKNVT